MGRSALRRPSPTVRPIRTETAMDSPSGNMKVKPAQARAIWCAASGTVPSQPIISAAATNAPASNTSCTAAGTPIPNISRTRAHRRSPNQARPPTTQEALPAILSAKGSAKEGLPAVGSAKAGHSARNSRRPASHHQRITAAMRREARVAQPAPSRPSAGAPRLP